MLHRIIDWSIANRFLVTIATVALIVAGVWSIRHTPLDALPDLSDVQVIVQTDYGEQAPRIVEDQVTYPIASEMLKVPGARTVRGYSFFGVSFVYVIFDDATELYWARSRVLEYLNSIQSRLPAGVTPELGPDATGLGWIFQYAIEDTTGRTNLAELRALQDWHIRYALTSVEGVAEVASVGGYEMQYQVDLDPLRLQAYGVTVGAVMSGVQRANSDVGAMVMELSEREYMVRARGYLGSIEDVEQVVVGANASGVPIRVADLGRVAIGPAPRRGVADLDGRGDVVGGIVIMRVGENALATIQRVKERIAELERSLPDGVVITPVYDRSDLIVASVKALRGKLMEEGLIVALVCALFLLHVRSALVAVVTLPLGILMAFIAMRMLGVGADIMSLGGVAIAIGAMIDAAIVMIENMHKHLEREQVARGVNGADLSAADRWRIAAAASREVGPPLFYSLLIITVSFIPVFALEGQEGRLFAPLAYTKTLAMASACLLAVTVVPVTMGAFIRGRVRNERAGVLNRVLMRLYAPVIRFVLRHRWEVVAVALATIVLSVIPMSRIGSEFMPPLNEGTLLFMPTTTPGISIATARSALRKQDSILMTFPEVARVFGKAGRANTATDPAGLDMFETTITLRPESEWRSGMTYPRLVAAMDSAVQIAGIRNTWTMPIRGRIDMLATGIRTPVGVKVFGPDLAELERIGKAIEGHLLMLPRTRNAFAERAMAGYYLDIEIDRGSAARHGLNIGDVQTVIAAAVGGMTVTQTVEGQARYGVRVRYLQELRDTPEKLRSVLIPASHTLGGGLGGGAGAMNAVGMTSVTSAGALAHVPLGEVATIRQVTGPMVVRTEDARPTAWVYVDVEGGDIGGYVAEAKRMIETSVTLPPGYSIRWSGQFEYMERVRARLWLVIPATLALIFLLLYLNFRNVGESAIVMLSVPFSLVGGLWLIWLLGYNWSVPVAVGFIALAGVAAETGIVMLIYLDSAWRSRTANGREVTPRVLHDAIMEGAVERLRPKLMTVTATIAALLPIMWGSGAGISITRRIAAPMIGGMVTSTILTLLVIPAIYALWRERSIRRLMQAPEE